MIKFYRRKIAPGMKNVRFTRADNRLLGLFFFFLFGMFFGSMASSKLFIELVPAGCSGKFIIDSLTLLLLLFFSTSFLGVFFIPIVVCARGFVFSALFSSALFFSPTGGVFNSLLAEAIPALLFLPCFYLLANDSMSLSSAFIRCRVLHSDRERSHLVRNLLISVPLLAFELLYCIYLLPLLLC